MMSPMSPESPSRRAAKRTDMKSTPTRQALNSKQKIDDELPLSYSSVEQDGQVARWKDLTTDQKWDYQFKYLVAYKKDKGNLSMPRKYTINYDDGKVVNIGKWLDNMKSAERSKNLDKKWLEQLENIGLFGSKTDDASDGAVGPDPFVVESVAHLHISTVSVPQNMEQLIAHSISDTPISNRQWITDDLFDELNKLRPDPTTDISPDGNRDAAALATKCESFFYSDRRFCSVRQLEATLQEFSNLWGFKCSRYGMSFKCHYAPPQKKESKCSAQVAVVDGKNTKPRTTIESVKEKVQCPFIIKCNHVTIKKTLPDWMFNSDGSIKHTDCYPVKITSCIYEHLCSPGVESQRYAMKRSGHGTLNIDLLQEMINILRDAGGTLENRILRSMLKNVLPSHVALTDQYLRNFKNRMMRFVMDPSLIERRKQEIERLIDGQEVAADEKSTFDEGVMGDNLRLLMIGQLQNSGAMWNMESYLIRCKRELREFDYRIWRSKVDGRPLGIVWVTEMMKKRLVRFGTVLFVDYMKRKYNKESWPYCAPVILDGNNEIGVVGESLNLSESLDGYFFVLNSIFEMVPEFDPSSVRLIFADDFINDSVLERLGMKTTILRADLWHLTHEQLPKYFGGLWNTVEEPMNRMLHSGSKEEWDTAYAEVIGRVQQYPEYSDYIKTMYDNPLRYSGYMLKTVEGNLERLGSSHVEQNHSSVVSALGSGASWKLEDQVHKLMFRQESLQRAKNENRLKYEMQYCRYLSLGDTENGNDASAARASLTEWAYNNLWIKSFRFSAHLEAEYDHATNSHKVRDRSKSWDDDSCIYISQGARCSCKKRVAFEFQCGHEYAIDKCFQLDKYHPRWFNTKTYESKVCSQAISVANHESTVKDRYQIDGEIEELTKKAIDDDDNIPTTNMEVNESIKDDVDYVPTIEDAQNQFELDGEMVDVTFNDLKRLALEYVDTASKSKESRRAAFHFLTEMLGATRSSSDISGVVHQMNTSILPDVATHFGAEMRCVKDNDIIQSPSLLSQPLPACPPKGGRAQNRYKSSLETRKNNPVKGGGQRKSCGFCKQSGHQLNNCWSLNVYGVRLTANECTHLAQLAFIVDAFATITLPQTRQIETVFESIPKQTCCVVIHERYAKIVSSNEISGHRDFLFDCTLLAIGGKFVELQMVTGDGTTSSKPLKHSLFTVSAICQYAYNVGKSKHLISQLQRIYSSSKIGVGDFGLPMLHEERVLEGKQGCDTGEEEKAENH